MSANQPLPSEPDKAWGLEVRSLQTGQPRIYLELRLSGTPKAGAAAFIDRALYKAACTQALLAIDGAAKDTLRLFGGGSAAAAANPLAGQEPTWHFPLAQHDAVVRALETTTRLPVSSRVPPHILKLFERPLRPAMTNEGLIKQLAVGCECCMAQHQTLSSAGDCQLARQLIDGDQHLFPYQREGVRRAAQLQHRILIADDMGLGKTRQAIVAAAATRRHCWPLLVVCPASLCVNWRSELLMVMPHAWLLGRQHQPLPPVQQEDGGSSTQQEQELRAAAAGCIYIVPNKRFQIPADARVVIVSYPMLDAIRPQLFPASVAAAATAGSKKNKMAAAAAATAAAAAQQHQHRFGTVILDEAHYIKNAESKRTAAAIAVCRAMRCRILLTGTPMSRPRELFSQLQAIDDTLYPDFWPNPFHRNGPDPWTPGTCFYGMRYCNPKRKRVTAQRWVWDWNGAARLPELYTVIERLAMIRRLKRDVLKDLPSKTRRRVIVDELQGRDLAKFTVARESAKTLLEEQGTLVGNPAFMELWNQTAVKKIPAILKYLVEVVCEHLREDPTLKVIVFGHHRAMIDAMTETMRSGSVQRCDVDAVGGSRRPATAEDDEEDEEDEREQKRARLEVPPPTAAAAAKKQRGGGAQPVVLTATHPDSGFDCIRIDGSTKRDTRQSMVDAFQQQDSVRCAVLSIQAASTGLTLTRATVVIITEMMFGPECMFQAEDRAHRIGQQEPVDIRYMMLGGSMDDSVWDMVVGKTRTIGSALNNRAEHLHAPAVYASNFQAADDDDAAAEKDDDDDDEAVAQAMRANGSQVAAAASVRQSLDSKITRFFPPQQQQAVVDQK